MKKRTISIYTKTGCMPCKRTKLKLERHGLLFQEIPVESTADALTTVKDLGFLTMPVVVVQDEQGNITRKWGGYKPEELDLLVEAA